MAIAASPMNFSSVPRVLVDHLVGDGVEPRQQASEILRIAGLAHRRGADHVGKEDGDEPPLFGHAGMVRGERAALFAAAAPSVAFHDRYVRVRGRTGSLQKVRFDSVPVSGSTKPIAQLRATPISR